MFNPESIAVFGASESGKSVGSRVFANLVGAGFEGQIYPVNPKYKTVAGQRCYKSIAGIDGEIDLAVIATPARVVPGIIADCGKAHVRNAVVITAGFGESGDKGQHLQEELLEVARRNSVRLLGPNCVGLVRPWLKMNASFLVGGTPAGNLALVSQSGALCSAISDWAAPNHLGFSALVSLGNAADIGFGDVIDYLATDEKTDAILLYVEGIKDAKSFMSALRIAAREKPVVVLKSGRHAKSAKAANTHTGALMGGDEVFDAALERAGAVRAMSYGQLFAAAEALTASKSVRGNRLCIITNGGGAGVLAADRAEDRGIELPPPSDASLEALEKLLPAYWSRSNPVDILGDAAPEVYGKALEICLADRSFDGVLVMLTPQAMTKPDEAAAAVVEAAKTAKKTPVLGCWMGETSVSDARKMLSRNGVPDFDTPESAVEAFSYLARHARNRILAHETPGASPQRDPADVEGARLIIEAALSSGRTMLSDIESKALLRAFHIPAGVTIPADSPAQALVAAETIGFPVAIKIASPQITHKSDVGGVRLNIMNAGDVRLAFREIVDAARAAKPDAEIDGVTVEAMAKVDNARELVVGVKRDPVFGPAILFGAGGTMVEVLKDSAVSLPPLTTVLAERLIGRTRVARLLEPFRNRPAVDRQAVVAVLMRISEMVAELPHIEELDINPLLAGPDGVLAVDARIRVDRPKSGQRSYDHMAISPYPRHLVETGYLGDGTPVTIRPIRPEDAESEQAFVRGLSAEARRFRFMRSVRELTPELLARFTQIDYRREMALVAMAMEDGGEVQRGVARYAINPDGTSCEFAIVVGDENRNRGIGTRLMNALMAAARQNGLTAMTGEVLAENRAMLQLMRDLEFETQTDSDDAGIVRVVKWLQDAKRGAAAAVTVTKPTCFVWKQFVALTILARRTAPADSRFRNAGPVRTGGNRMKYIKWPLAAIVAATTAVSAGAADVEWRLSHWVPPTHPIQTLGIEPWIESIKEASDGRINITIFPAQQLGAAPDHYDMTRDGIADIGYVNPGYTAGRFPIYSLIEVPFHVRDAGKGAVALHEWYAPIAETEMGDVKFCIMNPHDPGTIHSKKEVKVPADIKGMNVRPAHATMARFVNQLGGASVQVPAPAAREALAKGAADAITFPWNSIYIFGIDSETNYHLDMPFYISAQLLLINKAKYEALSPEDKKVIDDHCTPEWSGKFSAGWADNEASGRQKMIDSGEHTLYKPTDEEVQIWRDASAPVLEQWRADVSAKGADPDAIYKNYTDALNSHGVKY